MSLASGAQWNYTPRWTAEARDGWNAEDYSITGTSGCPRANFRPRPYPRATAGTPRLFRYNDLDSPALPRTLEFEWDHDPKCGETEVFAPAALFPHGSEFEVEGTGASVQHHPHRQTITCRSSVAGPIRLQVTAPAATIRLGRAQPRPWWQPAVACGLVLQGTW